MHAQRRGAWVLLAATLSCTGRQPPTTDVEAFLAAHGAGLAADPGATLAAALAEQSAAVRTWAAQQAAQLPPATVRAVADPLCRALADPVAEVRQGAALALLRLGADAAPLLVAALDDDRAVRRREASTVLARLQQAALPALRAGIGDGSERVRIECLAVLAQMPTAAAAGRELVGALDDDSPRVRAWALVAIGELGAAMQPAAPRVRALLAGDRDHAVREAAATCLGDLGAGDDDTVTALRRAAGDDEPAVRDAARLALQRLQR